MAHSVTESVASIIFRICMRLIIILADDIFFVMVDYVLLIWFDWNVISAFFRHSLYIVSPKYDWIGFIGAPVIALMIGWGVFQPLIPNQRVNVGYFSGEFWDLMVLVLMTQCHLFIYRGSCLWKYSYLAVLCHAFLVRKIIVDGPISIHSFGIAGCVF